MSGYRFDRLKILIADDNVHMRRLVSAVLHAFGVADIREACDAKQAWAFLREFNPDVIFLDWMMEGMNGIDLTKMVRTNTTSPNPFVPIIMLTGYTDIERVREARDAGVNEFLAKPVSVNAILTRLLAVVEHPRPFVRTKSYFGPSRRRRDGHEYCGPERRTATEYEANARAVA
jgi:two-component system chemotaxis response regulator CheY